MAKTHDIRLQPTREQRRELDRAAKACGLRHTGPWVLSVALGVARVGAISQPASGASKPALASMPRGAPGSVTGRPLPYGVAEEKGDDGRPRLRRVTPLPLTRSFDPDST